MNVSLSNITISPEDALWQANEKVFKENLPVVIYLSILMIVGVMGNVLVVYIYSRYFRKTTGNFYILTLSIFDIIAGVMMIPEVLDRRYPMYSGQIPALCKIVRMIGFVINGSSMGMLICIAFDRYYKVCYPMKCFTMHKAKLVLLLTIGLIILVTWPMAVFNGQETKDTDVPNVYGKDCADDDNFKNSTISMVYFTSIFVVYVVSFVVLVVMYSKIYHAIWKWKRTHIGEDLASIRRKNYKLSISENLDATQEKPAKDLVFTNSMPESVDKELEVKQIEVLDTLGKKKADISKTEESGDQNSPKLNNKYKTIIVCSKDNLNTAFECDYICDNETGEIPPNNEIKENSSDPLSVSNDRSGVNTAADNMNNSTPHQLNKEKNTGLTPRQSFTGDVEPSQYSEVNTRNEIEENQHMKANKLPENLTLHSELCTNSNCTSNVTGNSNLGLTNPAFNLHGKERNVPQLTPTGQDRHLNKPKQSALNNNKIEPPASTISTREQRRSRRLSPQMSSGNLLTNKSCAKMTNTTFIFCLVTITYICAYMPYFMIEVLNATGILNIDSLSLTEKQIVRVFNSSFILNNAVNPIIYSIFNPNFRYFVKNMFTCKQPKRKASFYYIK